MSKEHWQEQQLGGLHCPICNGSFRLIHLMAKPNRPLRAIVKCKECGQIGLGTVRLADQFYPLIDHVSSDPVTEDDVSSIRDFLDGFHGNFQELFNE